MIIVGIVSHSMNSEVICKTNIYSMFAENGCKVIHTGQ